MREMLATHADLAMRMDQIQLTQDFHASVINTLADEIEDIKRWPEPEHRQFGFRTA
jgi:hypothetical protein